MNKTLLLLAAGASVLAISSAASAADLMVEPAIAAEAVAASGNWDGAYVGAFGGYGWGALSDDLVPNGTYPEPAGWLLGVNAGVNFTLTDGIVAGIVGDIAWADMNETLVNGPVSMGSSVDWVGSVRGRLGFDGGAFMPYLTGGLAVAHNTVDYVTPGPVGSDDQIHVGWTAGAGVEFAATENVSVDLLYRYSDYGNATYNIGGLIGDLRLTSHQVTAGLNLGF